MYLNKFPQQELSGSLLFVNDMNLWKEVCNQNDKPALQRDLTRLTSSRGNNRFTFSISNFKVVHPRHVAVYEYNLGDSPLKKSQVEKGSESVGAL